MSDEKEDTRSQRGGDEDQNPKQASDDHNERRSTSRRTGGQTDRSARSSDRGNETPRDVSGRKKQNTFFVEELKRIEEKLEKESSKIKAPEPKEYTPYTFNTLAPYSDTNTPRFLAEMPEETRHGYVSRQTAQGLCDPWVDHRMDTDLLPRIESKPVVAQEQGDDQNKNDEKKSKDRPPKEGSTHLPKYPVVAMTPDPELKNKQLCYSDVPALREELRKKYSSQADAKIQGDYKRTKADFYRMELDKMDQYRGSSRDNMRAAYFAYLQNTPGSKKAIYECVHTIEKGNKEKNQNHNREAKSAA